MRAVAKRAVSRKRCVRASPLSAAKLRTGKRTVVSGGVIGFAKMLGQGFYSRFRLRKPKRVFFWNVYSSAKFSL